MFEEKQLFKCINVREKRALLFFLQNHPEITQLVEIHSFCHSQVHRTIPIANSKKI